MGERQRRWAGRRAAPALLAASILFGLPFVAPSAAHAVLPCPGGTPCLAAADDNYTMTFTTAGTALNVAAPGLLANDYGPSGNNTSTTVDLVESDTTSLNGATVFVHANGSFTYRPEDPVDVPFTGVDEFTYWIKDFPAGDQDFATAYITVNPVVRNDSYSTKKNTTLNVAAPGVFANDLGLDPANALWTADNTSAHGIPITLNTDGSFSYTPPAGYEGADTFAYTASDINGDNLFPATVTVHIDSTAPSVHMTAPTKVVSLSTKILVAWAGSDASGIAHYDVQVRRAGWNGTFTAWANWKLGTTATSATYSGLLGRAFCFRARGFDNTGNVSSYSNQICTAVPMSATSLGYPVGGWTRQFRTDVFGGVVYSTKTKGAEVRRTSMLAKRVYVVATKCITCGSIQVRWNNVVIANVNLAATGTLHKQVFWVGSFASVKSGTLTIFVTSASGKTVAIEGVAAYSE